MNDNNITLSGIFSEGYGINPKKLWRLDIDYYVLKNGKKAKGLYIKAILSYMLSYTGAGNCCFPSIRTIAEDLKISKDTVVNSINASVEMGMIKKEQLYPNDPLRHNNKYTLLFLNGIPNIDVRQERITSTDGTTFDIRTIEQNNNIINNNKDNNNTSRGEDDIYNKNKLLEYWNNSILGNIPKLKTMTSSRWNSYKLRLKEGLNIQDILEKIKESKFLQGDNNNNWTMTFDWLITNDKNWVKVMEDNYRDKDYKPKQPSLRDLDKTLFCVHCNKETNHYYSVGDSYWCDECHDKYEEK